jgi:NAD(P)-dependent dehydrogenase (short-subunit alcohol dehydrogenase family)
MSDEMKGKSVFVTGATSGIGRAAATALARKGADVIGVARSVERAEQALPELRAESGGGSIELMVADLSSQASVRRLAAAVKARLDHLDVLVNDAGALFGERRLSADGIEMTWALNHLGYFLLTGELLGLLLDSAPARVVSVASDAGNRAHIDFDDLQGERDYSGWRAYGQSKLANIVWTRELARHLAGTGVTAASMHPGFVATNFGARGSRSYRALVSAAGMFRRTPEQGADTVVYLASSPEVARSNGDYWVDRRPARPAREAYDAQVARRLWVVSEQLTELAEAA